MGGEGKSFNTALGCENMACKPFSNEPMEMVLYKVIFLLATQGHYFGSNCAFTLLNGFFLLCFCNVIFSHLVILRFH
jgi:hypothetical protein